LVSTDFTIVTGSYACVGVVAFVWYLDTSFTVRSLVTVSSMLFFAALHLSKQISLSNSAAATQAETEPIIRKSVNPNPNPMIDSSSPLCKAHSASVTSLFKKYDVNAEVRHSNWYRQLRYDVIMYVVPLSALGVALPMIRPFVHFSAFVMTFFVTAYLFITRTLYFRESPRENESIAADRLASYPHKFVNGWFRVMSCDELSAGNVKYIAANGRHLAVFRGDSDNKVKCIDAHCIHLGANMAIGGKVVNNCLECPFHRWTFNGEIRMSCGSLTALYLPSGNRQRSMY
jgi:nitrite reductase/ring-hydroxylating ferredoxin subunit